MITAKVILRSKESVGDGQTRLQFYADYEAGKNKEWAKYTPGLFLDMTVLDEVAVRFDANGSYTLMFEPEKKEEVTDGSDTSA